MRSPLWLLATPAVLIAAGYLIAGAFWPVVGIGAALVTLGSLAAAMHRAAENISLRAELYAAERTNEDLEQENMRLHLRLTEVELLAGVDVPVPLLRVVKPSREVSDYAWPAIVRAVEGEVSP